jgi:hypothetical protein
MINGKLNPLSGCVCKGAILQDAKQSETKKRMPWHPLLLRSLCPMLGMPSLYCCSEVPGGSSLLRKASVSRTVSTTLCSAPDTRSPKDFGAAFGAAFLAETFLAGLRAAFFALRGDALRAVFFLVAALTLTFERFTFLAFDAAFFFRAFLAMDEVSEPRRDRRGKNETVRVRRPEPRDEITRMICGCVG